MQSLDALLKAKDDDTAAAAQIAVLKETGIILRRERAIIETDRAIRWQPWLQLKAWFARDRPRFPDLP